MSELTRWQSGIIGLIRGPRWSSDRLRRFQLARVRCLVQHAYENVPFYRALFDQADVKPDDIRSFEDLGRLPFTTRSELQRFAPSNFEAQGLQADRLMVRSTSGSTGEPLTVRQSRSEQLLSKGLRLRALLSFGAKPWHRMTRVVFCPGESAHEQRIWKRWCQPEKTVLPRRDIHCLRSAEQILARIKETRPDILAGFPSALQNVAEVLSESDKNQIQPRMLVTGAEILTPAAREKLTNVFQAPLFDLYGAHEAPLIAYECPRGGQYHICEDALIAEILSDGIPVDEGCVGELIITVLHNYAMPFIRYRIGDLVRRGSSGCECGCQFATLTDIRGRIIDRFVAPDGAEIHPSSIDQPLRQLAPWITRYQVVQEALDLISIRVVPEGSPSVSELSRVSLQLSRNLGNGVQVALKAVDEIPLGPAGKFRLYKSNLSLEPL